MVIPEICALRMRYHHDLCHNIIAIRDNDTVNIADVSSKASRKIANELARLIGGAHCSAPISGQEAGNAFMEITKNYLRNSFSHILGLRPGEWGFETDKYISEYDQYRHLSDLVRLANEKEEVAILLGTDYLVKSDIVMYRMPISSSQIIDDDNSIARFTPLLKRNSEYPLLHATISCKWTMRSDRSQNTRTEALNLIRNRKGNTPHITAVTAEPLPTRIASLALGTGDIDCVYHIALPELRDAVEIADNEDQMDMLNTLVNGRRLRDISDLVFDLAI
jgi:hypothetical protein